MGAISSPLPTPPPGLSAQRDSEFAVRHALGGQGGVARKVTRTPRSAGCRCCWTPQVCRASETTCHWAAVTVAVPRWTYASWWAGSVRELGEPGGDLLRLILGNGSAPSARWPFPMSSEAQSGQGTSGRLPLQPPSSTPATRRQPGPRVCPAASDSATPPSSFLSPPQGVPDTTSTLRSPVAPPEPWP